MGKGLRRNYTLEYHFCGTDISARHFTNIFMLCSLERSAVNTRIVRK